MKIKVKGHVDVHLLDHRTGFEISNLDWAEYMRMVMLPTDDGSNGVCFLTSGKFTYRRGKLLIGTFDLAETCEHAAQETHGFLDDESYAKIDTFVRGFLKFSKPPAEARKVANPKANKDERKNALDRGSDGVEPPAGWEGRWLFDTTESAQLCGNLNPGTFRHWRSIGSGPAYVRVNGRVMYTFADLTTWVDETEFDATTGYPVNKGGFKVAKPMSERPPTRKP
jgi:hypothetical protein